MVDAWPATLPQNVLVNGYSEGVSDGLLEYPPDTGPPITRRRSSSMPRPLSMSFAVTTAQLATLRAFYDTTLSSGSLPFTFPGVVEAETYLIKFQKGGGPKWVVLATDSFTASMTVWILP
jgi:hypothetical protein